MIISPVHALISLIAIIFLTSSIVRYCSRESLQSFPKFFVSFCVWGSILFLALFPEVARIVSKALSIGENLNTLIFAGFVVILIVTFRLVRIIERLERTVTTIIRSDALHHFEKEYPRKKDS